MDDLTRFKELVTEAITEKFPSEAQLVEGLPEKAWEEYHDLIRSYNSGFYSHSGWSLTIGRAMVDAGVDPIAADILSQVRSDINLKQLEE